MRRGVRGRPLGIRGRLRNRRINRKRAPGEHPFAVIKRVFNAGHVLVTTVPRVRVRWCLLVSVLIWFSWAG